MWFEEAQDHPECVGPDCDVQLFGIRGPKLFVKPLCAFDIHCAEDVSGDVFPNVYIRHRQPFFNAW